MSKLEDPLKSFNPQDLSIEQQCQRHFLEPNGMLFTNYKDETCFCSHRRSQHLDCDDVCLVGNPICICSEFKNQRTITSIKENQSEIIGKRKRKVLEKHISKVAADPHVFDYIRTISKI